MFITLLWLLLFASSSDQQDDTPAVLPEAMERTRDARSGCLCSVYTGKNYVTCYDTKRCVAYPKDLNISLPTFRLSTTRIRVIQANDLIRHRNISTFILEMNEYLYRIDPGAFNNMSNIINVSISYNKNLQYLEKYAFQGLVNLRFLTLEQNGFHTLKDFTYAITHGVLPSLYRLSIASMPFDVVEADDFVLQNITIKEFFFTTCQLKSIDPIPFTEMKQLRVLELSENVLDQVALKVLIEAIMNAGIRLVELRLNNMGFNELPHVLLNTIANSSISQLRLARNKFEVIQKFPNMSNIELLDIAHSIALNITTDAFVGLVNLKYLCLTGNGFSDIPEAVRLPKIIHLDISYAGKYFSLEGNSFANMTNLKYLNLSGNNIRKLNSSTFKGLTQLQVLILEDCSIFFVNSSSFATLGNLIHLNLNNNPFPSRDVQAGLFTGLWKLQALHMGQACLENISHYKDVFANLTALKYLSLENNGISTLCDSLFIPLINLEVLNLSGNNLMSWDERIFYRNTRIQFIDLSNNKIKDVSVAMLRDWETLKVLDLSSNPFMCKCPDVNRLHNAYLRNEYPNALRLVNASNVSCTYPKSWSNRKLIEFIKEVAEEAECKETHSAYVIMVSAGVTFIVVVAVMSFIYRWHIRYWIFLTKLYLSRSGRVVYNRKKKAGMQYEYDAFVSYSSEDKNFVVQLVHALETIEPFYKLCVYERDFQIGTIISETVLDSVARSRKTLLIVSEAYIKSTWCRWEVQVAENKRLFWEDENGGCVNDSLIIVKLGKISTRQLSPMLKYLLKTRIYLEWDSDPRKQQTFYCRLRNTLAINSSSNG